MVLYKELWSRGKQGHVVQILHLLAEWFDVIHLVPNS